MSIYVRHKCKLIEDCKLVLSLSPPCNQAPVENIPAGRREDGKLIIFLFSRYLFEVNACLVLAPNIMVAAALRDKLMQIVCLR